MINLNNEEFCLLSMLKRRIFTPLETVADNLYDGSEEKARHSMDPLIKRNMIELVYNRVTITSVGIKATDKERIKRAATVLYISLETAE